MHPLPVLLLSILSFLFPIATALFPTDAPVQPGANPDCVFWGIATAGATCDEITSAQGFGLDAFFFMNPQLNRDCEHSLWAGYAYV